LQARGVPSRLTRFCHTLVREARISGNPADDAFDTYRSGLYDFVMGSGQIARQWSRIHRAMERPYDHSRFSRVLEVGGGRGEHLLHVRSAVDEYVLTDLRPDRLPQDSALPSFVTAQREDVQALSFDDHSFNRVVVSCVLPHVNDPVAALTEIHRVVKPGGDVCIYVPCEPGIALRMARRVWTVPRSRKFGVEDPYFLHFREHIHYFTALDHFIKREFSSARIKTRSAPLARAPWNLSLYRLYWITTGVDS
jgi:ubiquinone/menaquinone biosynthesis C-methylase UbiE